MVEFTVNKEFPLGNCRGKEGFFFNYDEGGTATLTVAFPRMKPLERDLVTSEHGRIGLFMYQGIIFVSAKFGAMDGDCAYSVHLSDNPQEITVEKAEKGMGLPLHIFAVESTTNVIQGIRTVGMGTRWTNEFSRMVEEQKKMPFDYAEYYGTVKMCQQRWSSKELMRMSTVTYKLGASERENPFEVIRGGKAE